MAQGLHFGHAVGDGGDRGHALVSAVVREIRLYVEGGGQSNSTKGPFREGMDTFLRELRDCARRKGIRWAIIACGGREQAFDAFQRGLRSHPTAFNVLLIDAEAAVQDLPWSHLAAHDRWRQPANTADDQCQLMIQAMEAWLIADPAGLARFYGQEFNAGALPREIEPERIEKVRLASALLGATRHTQKGSYQKIRHGAALLKHVDPAIVRRRVPSCERLFSTLSDKMGGC